MSSKREPQPAEPRTTASTKTNANAEAKRPTKAISTVCAETEDSKECLEREAGRALGVVALAPCKGALGRERIDDRPGILKLDLEGVLLAIGHGKGIEGVTVRDLLHGAF